MAETYVKIWRCTECRKWSHAKKKPRFHKRSIVDNGQSEPDPATVLSYESGIYSHINGDESPGWWEVKCGPFEAWWAVKI